jgi:hypothetical protein
MTMIRPANAQESAPAAITGSTSPDVPVRTRLAAYMLSIVVTVLALIACVAGLLLDGAYGEPAATAEMLRGYDLVALAVAVPALAHSMLRSRRGSQRAELVWAGALAYLAYTYAYYVFGTTFNDLFLLHIAVFGTSVFALVLVFVTLDAGHIDDRIGHRIRARVVAGLLAFLAVALGGMWVYVLLRYSATGDVPAGSALVETDAVVHLGIALDLALLVPAYGLAAVLLWRGRAWGYVISGVVLVSGVLHQLSYVVALPFQVVADVPGAVTFDPGEPLIVLVYAVATALLFWGAGPAKPMDSRFRRSSALGTSESREVTR